MGDVIAFPGSWHGDDAPQPSDPPVPEDSAARAAADPAALDPAALDRAHQRPVPEEHRSRPGRALLWREVAGHELRQERLRQSRTQSDVADRAGVSTQYLSEVERGRKEPSSEVLHAVSGALGLDLLELTTRVSRTLAATPATRSSSTSPLLLAA